METFSVAQRVANRRFATEQAIDHAIATTTQFLAETMKAQEAAGAIAPKLAGSVDNITESIEALVRARRAVEATDLAALPAPSERDGGAPKTVWRPDRWINSPAEIDVMDINRKTFAIELHDLLYACELTVLPEADRLYVSLHSFADRRTNQPPTFSVEPRLYDSGHVLRISDPSLFLNDELSVGGFLGSEARNPIEGVTAIAQHIAGLLGLRDGQVIYWGISAAGYAALRAATLSPNGRAVSINGLLEVAPFENAQWARPIRETFKAGWSFADIQEAYPVRSSVLAALNWARRRGHDPRFIMVQNDADALCYQDQFVPFCRAVGLDPAASMQDRYVKTIVYHNRRGHGAIPRSVVRRISDEGLPFLLGHEGVSGPTMPSWWNETYYLERNPDVAQGVRKGRMRSGLEHYQLFGAREHRDATPIGPE